MSDYTPNTEDVRRSYRAPAESVDLTEPRREGESFSHYLGRVSGVDAFIHQQASYAAFDRWLAAHDAAIERAERAEDARDGWTANAMEAATAIQRAERAEAALAAIREAVSRHPECDRYGEGDVPSCGWKRAFSDVSATLAALDTGEESE